MNNIEDIQKIVEVSVKHHTGELLDDITMKAICQSVLTKLKKKIDDSNDTYVICQDCGKDMSRAEIYNYVNCQPTDIDRHQIEVNCVPLLCEKCYLVRKLTDDV